MNTTNSSSASAAGPHLLDSRVFCEAVGNRTLMAGLTSLPSNRLGKCTSVPGWTEISSNLFCLPPGAFLLDTVPARILSLLFDRITMVLLDKHTIVFVTKPNMRDDFHTKVLGAGVFRLMRPRLAYGFQRDPSTFNLGFM